jgi:DNA end-binding protein Ku
VRLALVTIPIQIHTATEASNTRTNLLHKPSGKRVSYTITAGGKEVDTGDIVKGYPVAEDTYITFEPEEIDAIKLETKKTLDLQEFVKVEDIDPRYFETPYYITPEDKYAAEGYAVIQAALKKEQRLGLGQITMGSGREYLVAVGPVENGLVMYVLRYADELRKPEVYFADVPAGPAPEQLVDMAVTLIEENTSPWKPEAYQNSYEVALLELVKRKSKGKKVVARDPDERPKHSSDKVVDLMDALRKSMKGDRARESAEAPARKRPRKKAS